MLGLAGGVQASRQQGEPSSIILELHKIYRVLAAADAAAGGDLRIMDESGEDYLSPATWFAAVDLPRRVRGSLLRALTP